MCDKFFVVIFAKKKKQPNAKRHFSETKKGSRYIVATQKEISKTKGLAKAIRERKDTKKKNEIIY